MGAQPSLSDFVHEWFQKVWNEKDASAIDRMLNPDTEVEGLQPQDSTSLRGPEDFKHFQRALLAAIPDLHITISKVVEQGDWVSVRFVTEGTHQGPGLGTPPTNKRIQFSGIAMGRIRNSQWVEAWNAVDFTTLSQQIGGELRIG